MAGPSVYPIIPKEVLAGQSVPGDGWGKSDDHQALTFAIPNTTCVEKPSTTLTLPFV